MCKANRKSRPWETFFLDSILPAVTQRTNCQKQYPCSELSIKEEDIFRSFTQKVQTLAAECCTSELTVYFGKPFLLLSADERVLAEPPCSAKASAAGVRQQWAAPFCLQVMYGLKETVDFPKETYGNVILSGDHTNFSICTVFWRNAHSSSPQQQCQALAQGYPRDSDTEGDMLLLPAQPRCSSLNFSPGTDSPMGRSTSTCA